MITVVSGVPRSGTSMVMQMLEEGGIDILTDKERGPDEDNPKGYYEDERAKEFHKDQSWIGEGEDKAVKIVIPHVQHLPADHDYKVIVVERDLEEVIQSQEKMLERQAEKQSAEEREAAKQVFQEYIQESKQFLDGEDNVDFLVVNHRDVINNPVENAERIADFLNEYYDLDVEAMASVIDPDLYRNRAD